MAEMAANIDLTEYEIKAGTPLRDRILGNRMLVVGGIVVIAFLVMALFSPFLTTYDPTKMDFSVRLAPPSVDHWMGTDQFGRDIKSRIIYGCRISCEVGAISVIIGLFGGLILGAISGYARGWTDEIIMRIMDAILAFPPLLLAIGLVAAAGPSMMTVAITIGVVYIPMFSRVVRSAIMTEREKEYVEASRATGQSDALILLKHIGPNCISPILVLATVIFAYAVIIEAILSFLGVGVPPPTPSLGTMLDESRRYLGSSIYPALFPGIAISFLVLGLNLLGDGLRDFLDPRTYT